MSMAKCLDVNPLYLEGIEDDPAAKQGSVFEQLQKSEAIQFSLETSDAIRITLLLEAFSALNVKGRIEALKAISNLTYVPEYITSEGKMQGEVFALSDITALIEAVDRIAEKKRGIENG